MDRTRTDRVLDALAAQPPGALPVRLCAAAAAMLETPGVGVAMATSGAQLQTVGATGSGLSGEELQLTLGEGPTYDAYRHGHPVLIDDLVGDGNWPMLRRGAGEAGIRAIFAFPLRSGAAHFGAFTLYRDQPGPLDDGQYRDALVFGRVTLHLLITLQTEESSGDLHEMFSADGSTSWEVHQATGMVSAQLRISLVDALAMMRAHAFSSGSSLGVVAGAVVAGRPLLSNG